MGRLSTTECTYLPTYLPTRLGRTTPWTPLPTRPAPRNRLTEPEPKHKSNPSHTPKPLTLDS